MLVSCSHYIYRHSSMDVSRAHTLTCLHCTLNWLQWTLPSISVLILNSFRCRLTTCLHAVIHTVHSYPRCVCYLLRPYHCHKCSILIICVVLVVSVWWIFIFDVWLWVLTRLYLWHNINSSECSEILARQLELISWVAEMQFFCMWFSQTYSRCGMVV